MLIFKVNANKLLHFFHNKTPAQFEAHVVDIQNYILQAVCILIVAQLSTSRFQCSPHNSCFLAIVFEFVIDRYHSYSIVYRSVF